MISVAIIDDEEIERDTLSRYFQMIQEKVQEKIEVELFPSGEQFLLSSKKEFDFICLDIEMEGRNGIEIAREIRKNNSNVMIIFITNLAHLAIKGYEVQAFDFILKPVNYNSFYMKVQNAISILMKNKEKMIVINTTDGIIRISSQNLIYAEVNGHYLYYHTTTGVYKQKASMRELVEKLEGGCFMRCNNCYLINLKYVDGVQKDNLMIQGETLKISRPRKKEFLETLGNYMGGSML